MPLSMISKADILKDLIENVYCRIRPSATHGVGVFAIRPIPKGANPFRTLNQDTQASVFLTRAEVLDNPLVDEEVKQMVRDFHTGRKGMIEFPSMGLNELNISFFMNTSDNPNIGTDTGESFTALRDITKGEELTVDYDTFSDPL